MMVGGALAKAYFGRLNGSFRKAFEVRIWSNSAFVPILIIVFNSNTVLPVLGAHVIKRELKGLSRVECNNGSLLRLPCWMELNTLYIIRWGFLGCKRQTSFKITF